MASLVWTLSRSGWPISSKIVRAWFQDWQAVSVWPTTSQNVAEADEGVGLVVPVRALLVALHGALVSS